PECFGAIARFAGGAAHLQRAGQRLGVVLQRDHAQHRAAHRIDQHEAGFDQLGRSGKRAHDSFTVGVALLKISPRMRFMLSTLTSGFLSVTSFTSGSLMPVSSAYSNGAAR